MADSTPRPTPEQFSAYQQMYDYFNQALFGGELPSVFLTFSRRPGSLGHFGALRWRSGQPDKLGVQTHEIALNASHLSDGPMEVADTLVHEMCHLWQQEKGHPSRGNYHNKEWANKMESIGLIPSHTAKPGGRKTGQGISDYPAEGGPFLRALAQMPEACKLPWQGVPELSDLLIGGLLGGDGQEEGEGGEGAKPKPRSKVKYSCPLCKSNVWGKPALRIVCGDCGGDYEVAQAA